MVHYRCSYRLYYSPTSRLLIILTLCFFIPHLHLLIILISFSSSFSSSSLSSCFNIRLKRLVCSWGEAKIIFDKYKVYPLWHLMTRDDPSKPSDPSLGPSARLAKFIRHVHTLFGFLWFLLGITLENKILIYLINSLLASGFWIFKLLMHAMGQTWLYKYRSYSRKEAWAKNQRPSWCKPTSRV